MKLTNDKKILIVGLGLIGGSYAKALIRKGYHVSAITRSEATIRYALEHGIITEGTTEIDPRLIGEADLVVFALYPRVLTAWLEQHQQHFKPGAILTDVTGVKCCVVYDIQKMLRRDVEFIGAHPMAGREVYGIENSDETIFRNANYIVTPTDRNTEEATSLCEQLGWELGFARVSRLSPEKHDDMIGFLSQLTHCIAVALMNCNDTPGMEAYTGDSFRDLTRIARINDQMWSELFLCNRDQLLMHMDAFTESFSALRDMLSNGDAEGLREAMRKSTARRGLFDKDNQAR
jgi:prephenate dehydrogenase